MKKDKYYHCVFSDTCKYGKNFPENKKYQIIEKMEIDKPVFKDKEIKRSNYKCKALKNKDIECSWIENLNMTDLGLVMSFTALKNTDAITYALKMTEDDK